MWAMTAEVPRHVRAFWESFLGSHPDPTDAAARFYESFRVGSSERDANEAARLILEGRKTATSSLLCEYEQNDKPLPYVGALSVVEDGERKPVCIVRTMRIEVVSFGEVDAQFAREYGEGYRTLEGWRKMSCNCYSNDTTVSSPPTAAIGRG